MFDLPAERSEINRKSRNFGLRQISTQISAYLHTSCKILEKPLKLLEPQFHPLQHKYYYLSSQVDVSIKVLEHQRPSNFSSQPHCLLSVSGVILNNYCKVKNTLRLPVSKEQEFFLTIRFVFLGRNLASPTLYRKGDNCKGKNSSTMIAKIYIE